MAVPTWVARANRYLANPIVKEFAGRVPPFALLEHRGRQSGKRYRIPMIVFRTGDTFTIALTYGAKTDWVKNVLAAGCCTIEYRRRLYRLVRPRLGEDPALSCAPLPVRLIEARVGATEYLRLDIVLRRDKERASRGDGGVIVNIRQARHGGIQGYPAFFHRGGRQSCVCTACHTPPLQ